MDKFKFAQVISFITTLTDRPLSEGELRHIDGLLADDNAGKASSSDVNYLLGAIKNNQKIEAIKGYRTLTGAGLLESKTAVEMLPQFASSFINGQS